MTKRKTVKPMTENTLLEALQRAMQEHKAAGNAEGMSVTELSEASGVYIATVRLQLRKMINAGKCTVGFQYRSSIAGYLRRTPVYQIKK